MLDNYEIDEPELRRYSKWLTTFSGVTGIVTNGQADEVLTLTAEERVQVTSVVVDAVKGCVPVILRDCLREHRGRHKTRQDGKRCGG